MKQFNLILLCGMSAILSILLFMRSAHAIPMALAEFDTFTVSIAGPGLAFLSPFGVSSSKKAEANGQVDNHPLSNFPLPLPVVDPRVADKVVANASAEAKEHDFNILNMVFHDYTAKAQGEVPANAVATGLGSLDFLINGDPGIGDSITIGYSFTGANLIATEDATAWMNFNIFGGLDLRKIRFNQGDAIKIDPVTIDLQPFEGGELVGISVIPRLYAAVPEPSTAYLAFIGAMAFAFVRKRNTQQGNEVTKLAEMRVN